MADNQTMQVRVVAQDPNVRVNGRILTDLVTFPAEELDKGPCGHRVQVIDYDSSTKSYYGGTLLRDPRQKPTNREILRDPAFHAQNVYGLVMSTVARFEFALGRRVPWGFNAHQLKVVPHAFDMANAFYAPDAEALLFGYFERAGERVFTCLSHDVVVHETTHALVDGLRGRFLKASSADQGAFHEGFADIVALLSVFSMTEVVARLVDDIDGVPDGSATSQSVPKDRFSMARLQRSALSGLAEQMAPDDDPGRIGALRRSVTLKPDPNILSRLEFRDSHRRGEVLVAAVWRTFLDVWAKRLLALSPGQSEWIDRGRAVEEGANIAGVLLTMMIRALDYTPPVHLLFGDFLSAALTADAEVRTDDRRYHLRDTLRTWFAAYGIAPAASTVNGEWAPWDEPGGKTRPWNHPGVRFSSVQSDRTEMFRLFWANRKELMLDDNAFTWVHDLWPSTRIDADDGFAVRETVATCIQYLDITADELPRYGLRKPPGMPRDTSIKLEGGVTLVLDEYGRPKYRISNGLPSKSDAGAQKRAQNQIDHLYEIGAFEPHGVKFRARLANIHRLRVSEVESMRQEKW
jgi:hypothetical protein